MITTAEIASNIAHVKAQIAIAAHKAGRSPNDVTLVAVTKTHTVESVRAVLAAGVTNIGENKIQEAIPKIEELKENPEAASPRWHLIGHLQSNKAKLAVEYFDVIHSVDSVKLAQMIDRHASSIDKFMDILIQINISGEKSKTGIHPRDASEVIQSILYQTTNVKIAGFMTMAPFQIAEEARPHFRALRELRDGLAEVLDGHKRFDPTVLSMGMSNDYLVAIEEGATLVRVGSAIFGARETD